MLRIKTPAQKGAVLGTGDKFLAPQPKSSNWRVVALEASDHLFFVKVPQPNDTIVRARKEPMGGDGYQMANGTENATQGQDQLSSSKIPNVDLTVGSGSGEPLFVHLDDCPYLTLMGLEGGPEGTARFLECPAQGTKPKSVLVGHRLPEKACNSGGRRAREPAMQVAGKLREVFRQDTPGEKECIPNRRGVSVA